MSDTGTSCAMLGDVSAVPTNGKDNGAEQDAIVVCDFCNFKGWLIDRCGPMWCGSCDGRGYLPASLSLARVMSTPKTVRNY